MSQFEYIVLSWFSVEHKNMVNNISQSRITSPLLVTEGMLLTMDVALSFAIQLLEDEVVVDETPVVTVGLTLSIFMFGYVIS